MYSLVVRVHVQKLRDVLIPSLRFYYFSALKMPIIYTYLSKYRIA